MIRLRPLVLGVLMALAGPASVSSQDFGVLLGLGHTRWSGPGTGPWGDGTGLTLGALTAEWPLRDRLAGRLEVGGGERKADLGRTGIFAQETRLSLHRVHAGAFLRPSWGRLFLEGGVLGWLSTLCDVDLEGGPSLLGGETEDCGEWVTDDDTGPIASRGSGLAWSLGAGLRVHRGTIGLRFESDATETLASPLGQARPRLLQLTAEWVFASRKDAGSSNDARSGRGRLEGSVGDALAAGVLEFMVPSLGYLYAERWPDGLVPNAVRMTGPLVMVVGWGTDSEDVLIAGAFIFAAGTVWATVDAALHGWRMGTPLPEGSSLLVDVGGPGAAGVGLRFVR